jgi:hypothetical protein
MRGTAELTELGIDLGAHRHYPRLHRCCFCARCIRGGGAYVPVCSPGYAQRDISSGRRELDRFI